MNNSKD
jgi:hypothetical protein